jgi:hypothetical protein
VHNDRPDRMPIKISKRRVWIFKKFQSTSSSWRFSCS